MRVRPVYYFQEKGKPMTAKSNRRSLILTFIFFAIVIILLSLYVFFNGRIAQNPAGTVGNTAGNLNNNGLFCEQDGVVYFANAYDNGTLYSMNTDETNVKKLSDAQVHYINAAGKYLYYYQSDYAAERSLGFVTRSLGVYRSSLKGTDTLCLKKEPSGIVALADNTVYYQNYNNKDGMTLYQIDTNKKNDRQVLNYIVNPACIENGILYYNGTGDDHYLYSYDTLTGAQRVVWEGNLWNPIVFGGYVYYMDVANDYRLCRRELTADASTEVLTTDRVDMFNLAGDYVYYQKSSVTEPAFKRMRTDGSENEIIAEGNYQNINTTSLYVYFNEYGAPFPVYKTPLYGAVNVTEFTAARDVLLPQ